MAVTDPLFIMSASLLGLILGPLFLSFIQQICMKQSFCAGNFYKAGGSPPLTVISKTKVRGLGGAGDCPCPPEALTTSLFLSDMTIIIPSVLVFLDSFLKANHNDCLWHLWTHGN